MSVTWQGDEIPPREKITVVGWLLVIMRGGTLGCVLGIGLLVLLMLRLLERPFFGQGRPLSPYVTQMVCRSAFRILGMPLQTRGRRMKERGAVVANHVSWLDIFALNARKNVYFVAKAEVAGWPGIGTLAKATGTLFIRRDPREARKQTEIMENRLRSGHKLLFFPEGTSTDGMRVLPFKTTLFASFFADDEMRSAHIQPVSVIYHAPSGADPRYYGWWGDMGFGEHLLKVLATPRQGRVEILYHDPVQVGSFPDRKSLARYLEDTVRAGHSRLKNPAA